jgi:hypothetical protein
MMVVYVYFSAIAVCASACFAHYSFFHVFSLKMIAPLPTTSTANAWPFIQLMASTKGFGKVTVY